MTPEIALSKIQASINNGLFEYYTVYDAPRGARHELTAGQPSYVTRGEAIQVIGAATSAYRDSNPFLASRDQWWVDGNTAVGKGVSLCLSVDDLSLAVVLVGTRSLPWSG